MSRPPSDSSVHEEPHRQGDRFRPDPSEARAQEALRRSRSDNSSEDDLFEHSVWDEPGLSSELAGEAQAGQITYKTWLERRRRQIGPAKSWAITLAIALLAGPWALVGALWGSGRTAWGALSLIVFAPVVEETMKTAAALVVIEKRPFFFRSTAQIVICMLAGALVFACVENLLYLKVYIRNPSPVMTHWRWTVCVALHMGCTCIAGLGVIRIWRDVWQRRGRPRLHLGFPYAVTAIVLHGAYNAFALILSLTRYAF